MRQTSGAPGKVEVASLRVPRRWRAAGRWAPRARQQGAEETLSRSNGAFLTARSWACPGIAHATLHRECETDGCKWEEAGRNSAERGGLSRGLRPTFQGGTRCPALI